MNWEYISGFFDADGSITVTKVNKEKQKTLQISFSNNEYDILEKIRLFILDNINVKGSINKKKIYKETHNQSFELKYVYQNAHKVSLKIKSFHKKKMHRIKVYNEIQKITPRNGKYSEELLNQRNKLIEEFFNATPSISTFLIVS